MNVSCRPGILEAAKSRSLNSTTAAGKEDRHAVVNEIVDNKRSLDQNVFKQLSGALLQALDAPAADKPTAADAPAATSIDSETQPTEEPSKPHTQSSDEGSHSSSDSSSSAESESGSSSRNSSDKDAAE